jgi:hypothetical protein
VSGLRRDAHDLAVFSRLRRERRRPVNAQQLALFGVDSSGHLSEEARAARQAIIGERLAMLTDYIYVQTPTTEEAP